MLEVVRDSRADLCLYFVDVLNLGVQMYQTALIHYKTKMCC